MIDSMRPSGRCPITITTVTTSEEAERQNTCIHAHTLPISCLYDASDTLYQEEQLPYMRPLTLQDWELNSPLHYQVSGISLQQNKMHYGRLDN